MVDFNNLANIDKLFDEVIHKTTQTVQKSKEDIYQIGETARQEYERVKYQLKVIKEETANVINKVDQLKGTYQQARTYLMIVNRDFKKYTQKEIEDAYFQASQLQGSIAIYEEREKSLRLQRDNLQKYCRNLKKMIERAEELTTNINLALKFLTNDWQQLNIRIGELQQMKTLGMSIIKAQEEERKRVAREIHDGPAQSMANIVMRAEYCLKLIDKNPELTKVEMQTLTELVRKCLAEVRKIIFDLRPMVLDDLGLVPALKRYTEKFSTNYDLHIEITTFGPERRLNSSVEVALFRIIQESLSNIKKHAHASTVLIKLEYLYERINIVVKDNGCGFNVPKALSEQGKECFGLMGMRERMQLLRGKLDIKSVVGKGTEIMLSLPFENN